MTSPIANLVAQQTISVGAGSVSLNSVQGRQTFNTAFGLGGSNKFFYFIANNSANEWEVGTGHLSDSATLVRDTVLDSSNSGDFVNFSAGTKDVVNDVPSQYQVSLVQPSLRIVTSSGAVTLISSDKIVEINKTVGAATIVDVDPTSLVSGKLYTVKDGKGDADVNPITIILTSGTFDGSGTYTLNYPYQAITFYSTGTNLRGQA